MNWRREIRGVTKIEGDEKALLRLMNICGHKDIKTWGEESRKSGRGKGKREDQISGNVIYIYSDEAVKVDDIARNCYLDVKMSDVSTLRILIRNNRKRLSIVLGILAFAIFIYIESLYIWRIDVDGCGNYTEEEVLEVIEQYYPCFGKRKNRIRADRLEKEITDHLEDVCWASCSINGTKLSVRLSESVDVFVDDTPEVPCNLVASMDCTVYSIVTSAGTPVVNVGDEVKKGDQLISGLVNICNDDSEVVDTKYIPAQGEIIGQSHIPYHDVVSASHYKKTVKDSKLESVRFRIGSQVMSLYDRNSPVDIGKSDDLTDHDIQQSEHWLHIGDFYLPVTLQISRLFLFDIEVEKRSPDAMKGLAEQHIVTYIGKLQEKGVQIVQKNVIITNGSDEVTADGDITVRMSVGVPKQSDQTTTEEE